MAKRFGGAYSPDGRSDKVERPRKQIRLRPAGGRANVLFTPAIVLVATTFSDGAVALTLGLAGAAMFVLSAWMLREGLAAEAEYHDRKVARRPAVPRKILACVAVGLGAALAVLAHLNNVTDIFAAVLFGLCASALQLVAFGVDPLSSKGMEGIDTFQ